MEQVVSGVSAALAGIFKEQLAPHLSGVLWKMLKCQGLDGGALPSDPEIQWVVKKRLRSTRCVSGLKGHSVLLPQSQMPLQLHSSVTQDDKGGGQVGATMGQAR